MTFYIKITELSINDKTDLFTFQMERLPDWGENHETLTEVNPGVVVGLSGWEAGGDEGGRAHITKRANPWFATCGFAKLLIN